jgi:hypothetical protein
VERALTAGRRHAVAERSIVRARSSTPEVRNVSMPVHSQTIIVGNRIVGSVTIDGGAVRAEVEDLERQGSEHRSSQLVESAWATARTCTRPFRRLARTSEWAS